MGKLLKTTRVVLAIILYAGINCLLAGWFVDDFPMLAWLGRVQIFPAVIAHAGVIVVAWGVATLFLGRVYCSTMCPLGVFMDIASRASRLVTGSRAAYAYVAPMTAMRYIFLALACVCSVISFAAIPVFLDPYTDYAYFIGGLVKAMAGSGGVRAAAVSTLGAVTGTMIVVGVGFVAAMRGRLLCSTVCPVGTALGILSRESYMRIDINTDRCTGCLECERVCKSECIDLSSHVVDMSRCVVCFDCLTACPDDAIHYTRNRHRLSLPLMQTVAPTGATAACADTVADAAPASMKAGASTNDNNTSPR